MSGYFTLQGKLCKQKNGHHKYCNGEDEVKVENPVDQIEGCGLCAVQVRAMRSEHVVQHDVEAGNDGLPVVVGVHQDLRGQDAYRGDYRPVNEHLPLLLEYQNVYSDGEANKCGKWPTLNSV